MEEAGATVHNLKPFALTGVPYVHQVHMFYLADMATPAFSAGEESLEVGFYTEAEVPWKDLAFLTVIETLKMFFADRKAGKYGFHVIPVARISPR